MQCGINPGQNLQQLYDYQFFPPSVVKRKKVVYLGFELVFSTIILNSQDRETAAKLLNSCEKTQLYRELASAAESGWDFSTRWMRFGCALFNFSFILWSKYCDWIDYCFRNASDLTTLSTTFVLPVDLNAFILKVRLKTSFWMLVIQLIALFSLAKTNEYHLFWVRWNSI